MLEEIVDRFDLEATTSKYDTDRPLALLHIPKTGGTALNMALIRATGLSHDVRGFDRTLFGAYDEFETWYNKGVNSLVYSKEQMDRGAKYISGHFGFVNIQGRYPKAQFITLIREPRSRLLSLWAYWRSLEGDLSTAIGTYASRLNLARGPLFEFLSDPRIAPQTDNVCARLLLWPHPLIPGDGFIDSQDDDILVGEALCRLQGFDQVYVNENHQWSQQLELWLGRSVEIFPENTTKPTPEAYRTSIEVEINDGTTALINERTRIDARIWRSIYCAQIGCDNIWVIQENLYQWHILRLARIIQGDNCLSLPPGIIST